MILDKKKLLRLYKNYDKVLGPYTRKDGRKHIILSNSTLPKSDKSRIKTVSYPKALMEVYLLRRLLPHETVDHINNDKRDDRASNLQILSLSENVKKAHRDGIAYRPPIGTKLKNVDNSGSKNGMSRLTESEVSTYRKQYNKGRTKKSIIKETGLSRRSVENFLFGKSYTSVKTKCIARPWCRENDE